MTTLKTFAFAAALAAFSTAASAGDVSFRFHADDLGNPDALYERMAARAEAACATTGRQPLWAKKVADQCAAGLLDDFVAGAASGALTAVHEQSTRDRLAALR